MKQPYDLVEKGRLKKILKGYAEAFGTEIYLFAEDRRLLLRIPEDAAASVLPASPLLVRGNTVGYVSLSAGAHLTQASRNFIVNNLAEILEMGLEIESLAGEVARNYEELSLSWKLSARLGAGLDVRTICDVLADEVMNICPSNNVVILLKGEVRDGSTSSCVSPAGCGPVPETKTFFFPKISRGTDSNVAATLSFRTDRGLFGYVSGKKEPVTVCDVTTDERFEGMPFPVTRILLVPLLVEKEVIGLILATDKTNGEEYFTTEIRLISSLASECAVSIKKAALFEELRSILFSIAASFSIAIEAKDPYTYGHSKRVSELAADLSVAAGYEGETLAKIRLAALLHDIGKIGTPEGILRKNDGLTEDEMGRIKEHPAIGSQMIGSIHRMKEIAQWICHHHERYDGKGYPSGLKDKAIPPPSRIIAIADHFDALTSERPYRKAYSREEAIAIMRESAGTHLDPFLFELFEKLAGIAV